MNDQLIVTFIVLVAAAGLLNLIAAKAIQARDRRERDRILHNVEPTSLDVNELLAAWGAESAEARHERLLWAARAEQGDYER